MYFILIKGREVIPTLMGICMKVKIQDTDSSLESTFVSGFVVTYAPYIDGIGRYII